MKELSSIIVGIIIAITTYIPLEIVKEETKIQILANLLSAISGVNFGFSLAETNNGTNVWNLFDIHVFIEIFSVIIMILFSIKGIQKKSYNIICLGYIFHGMGYYSSFCFKRYKSSIMVYSILFNFRFCFGIYNLY